MATNNNSNLPEFKNIPFKMHPRVFAALGADLVTNDVVALIELVKNSYDAFASNVLVKFGEHPKRGQYIEIKDDGYGMSKEVVEDVWCTVATPYRVTNTTSTSNGKVRRVSGEKGLGRLSVARLGGELSMLTKAKDGVCLQVRVSWDDISNCSEINHCFVKLREYTGEQPFKTSGTILRIYKLKSIWNENTISDLEDNLARLLSPFSKVGDFEINLTPPGETSSEPIKIKSPPFLSKPKYRIAGNVNLKGAIDCTYSFSPIKEGTPRLKHLSLSWSQVVEMVQEKRRSKLSSEKFNTGPFSFEIRAWDIGADDTQEIADQFSFQKNKIRKTIGAHKGISVYRDNLLVLPKSDDARDWLGLDLRRISKIGTRLSTSQIVGYISISAEHNPNIVDTSNREGLAYSIEVAEFQELLKAAIAMMENERDIDRSKVERSKPLDDLFSELDTSKLVDQTNDMVADGAEASDFLNIIRSHSSNLELAKKTIQERFEYYSRLATVGIIAQMIVHEIRNRTTCISAFLDLIVTRFGPFKEKNLLNSYTRARDAIQSLERLTDTFSPLASRGFRKRRKDSILEERIKGCISLQDGDINRKHIICKIPHSKTHIAVDPGELDAVIINLSSNAIYWLGQIEHQRELSFLIRHIEKNNRVQVHVIDNGPGIPSEIIDKIFWPGVTRRPGGIGMGLTVASEIIAEYGGKLGVGQNSPNGGAQFVFDIPLKI
jgi:signal transduction histidine kinase